MSKSQKKPSRRRPSRRLHVQSLERRQLLAGDIVDMQNVEMPEDVNADGQVTSLDALMVINRIRQERGGGSDNGEQVTMFRDVNGDGQVTSLDALRVINRMLRSERLGSPAREEGPGPGNRVPRGGNEPDPDLGRRQPRDEQDPLAEIRSYDGTGNNLDDPTLGAAGTAFVRVLDPNYVDGIGEPSGQDRPSAREISNVVSAQDESVLNDRRLSDLVWQWGQFIDHDIDLTAEGHEEAFNIPVPTGDPFFDPFNTGTQEISLTRSAVAEGTGIDSPRDHVNEITAFIDGSMVYGSSEETANSLRAFEGGRLLTSEGDLLPIDEFGFFQAGDVRANEQNGLTAMHTLWVREHNRLADEIAASDPSLSDEAIFQQARATVIGEIQAITFNEYLPSLLGRDAVPRYQGYDATVDPSISNFFATAAFRYGHTTLSGELKRLDDDGNVIEDGHLALRDAFFNPAEIVEQGIDSLLKGLSANISQEVDTMLVDDVRNFLFGPPGAGGFDLAALNIQRGRDHGLPDYNSVRQQLGLDPAETFADISSDPDVQARLEEAYGSVDDIDVWVGALAEDHVRGGSVGELTRTALLNQFTALRDGDRFWYQNIFSGQQLREIDSTRLSDVIERNTELTSIQRNAFVVPVDSNEDRSRPRPPQPVDPPVPAPVDPTNDNDGGQGPDDVPFSPRGPQPVTGPDGTDGDQRPAPRGPQAPPDDGDDEDDADDEERRGRPARGLGPEGVDVVFGSIGRAGR